MPRSINLTGTSSKSYNLDEIASKNTRTSSNEELFVQIWYWNPNLDERNPHSKPNPENPVIGQMWLSKLITADSNPEEFAKISSEV